MSLTGRRLLILAPALAALVSAAAMLPDAVSDRHDDGVGRILLVSGRDDHGLVAQRRVALLAGPASIVTTGEVADGTLARVLRTRGDWLELRSVEGPRRRGWLNDYYLRGVVHLVGAPPDCRTRIGGRILAAGEQATVEVVRRHRVRVTTVRRQHTGWVARSAVQEFAPSAADC